MIALAETAETLEHACECCARVFTPPEQLRQLRRRDRLSVLKLALEQTWHRQAGPVSAYRAIRPRYLAWLNERSFEEFVAGFSFCTRCRGFICRRCWHSRRMMCRACVAAERLRLEERASARLRVLESERPNRPVYRGLAERLTAMTPPPVAIQRLPEGAPAPERPGVEPAGELPGRGVPFLRPLLRPGRVRTATSVALMVFTWMLCAVEAACIVVGPVH